jgi:LCP family protein required for cell wall assembly
VFAEEEPEDVLGVDSDPWPLDGDTGPVFLDELLSVPEKEPAPPPAATTGALPTAAAPAGESRTAAASEQTVLHTRGAAKRAGDAPPAWLRGLAGAKTKLAAKGGGWLNLLLVGGDAGYGRSGLRTDTMIVVSLQAGTGKAVAFGIPRNMQSVPLPGEAGRIYGTYDGILNALYGFGRLHPELFPGGRDAGVTALKQTISQLLGIPIHYYALVDLRGFVEMVDALGGVTVKVTDRVEDEVSPPYQGEPWIPIDVHPGDVVEMDGRLALAYARSRWATSDYNRMRRQRCLLDAMAHQVDVVRVLRSFPRIAGAIKKYVSTDIPLGRVPDLVELITNVDSGKSVAESFAPPRYSLVPDVEEIRAQVRRMILLPASRLAAEGVQSLRTACG